MQQYFKIINFKIFQDKYYFTFHLKTSQRVGTLKIFQLRSLFCLLQFQKLESSFFFKELL